MKARNLALVCLLGAISVRAASGKSAPTGDAAAGGASSGGAMAGGASQAAPANLGIAVYAGAEMVREPHQLGGDKSEVMMDSVFKSADESDKVADFYREELRKAFHDQVMETPMGDGKTQLQTGNPETGKNFQILVRTDDSESGTVFSIRYLVKAD